MARPGTAPRVPAATCLECRRCGQGAYGFQHRLLLHDTQRVQRAWLWGPVAQLPISLCPYTYHVLPVIPAQPLCSSFPVLLLHPCGSLFLSLPRAVTETLDRLYLLYTCFSSQAPSVSISQTFSLGVLASLLLLGHPQEQYSSYHRSRTQ